MKAKTLYKIFFAVLCAIIGLFGCSVPTPDPAPAPHVPAPSQIVVSGTINTDNGRSAIVDLDKLNLTWYVIATQEKVPTETDPKAAATGTSFSLVLPNEGTWVFWAGGFAGQPNDTYTNYVIGGMTDIITVPKSGVSNLTITASPQIRDREFGSVSLSFTDESGKLDKVYVKGYYPLTGLEFSFANGSATLTCSSVLANEYPVTLLFNDAYGNTLYRCKEVINVIQDCTTDTWSGNSTYLKSGVFTITQDMIDAYGTEIVPDTGTVLYDNWCDEEYRTTHRYYFSNISSPIIDESWGEENESDMPPISFTFDNAGNLYVLNKSGEAEGSGDTYTEIKTNFGSAETKTITVSDIDFKSITIDRKTDMFYGAIVTSEWDDTEYYYHYYLHLYSCPEINSNEPTDNMKYYSFGGDILSGYYNGVFTINGNKLYIPRLVQEDNLGCRIKLVIVPLTEDMVLDEPNSDPKNISDDYIKDITPASSDIELNEQMMFTDIIYQDGCIYMLLREHTISWGDKTMSSRGAAVKYDFFDGSSKVIGWSKDQINGTEIPNMYLFTDSDTLIYSDTNGDEVFKLNGEGKVSNDSDSTCNSFFPTVYGPSSIDGIINQDYFYGPQKFVAIKPKKLVIADDGLAFYIDSDGGLSYKNVNNVVTLDLETFAFAVRHVGVCFDSDFDSLTSGSGFYKPAYYTGSWYDEYGEEQGWVQLGIKNDD